MFVALRPRTMEGFDSHGRRLSIDLPIDPYAMATTLIVAAFLGAIVTLVAQR